MLREYYTILYCLILTPSIIIQHHFFLEKIVLSRLDGRFSQFPTIHIAYLYFIRTPNIYFHVPIQHYKVVSFHHRGERETWEYEYQIFLSVTFAIIISVHHSKTHSLVQFQIKRITFLKYVKVCFKRKGPFRLKKCSFFYIINLFSIYVFFFSIVIRLFYEYRYKNEWQFREEDKRKMEKKGWSAYWLSCGEGGLRGFSTFHFQSLFLLKI